MARRDKPLPRLAQSGSRWPSPGRIGLWLLLLLCAFGLVTYARHGWLVLQYLGGSVAGSPGVEPAQRASLYTALAWDGAYLMGAALTVAGAMGVLRHREWARRLLQVMVVVLLVVAVISGVQLLMHWREFTAGVDAMMANPDLPLETRAMLLQQRRISMMALVLKALSVPFLLAMAWWLGRPALRARCRPHLF